MAIAAIIRQPRMATEAPRLERKRPRAERGKTDLTLTGLRMEGVGLAIAAPCSTESERLTDEGGWNLAMDRRAVVTVATTRLMRSWRKHEQVHFKSINACSQACSQSSFSRS